MTSRRAIQVANATAAAAAVANLGRPPIPLQLLPDVPWLITPPATAVGSLTADSVSICLLALARAGALVAIVADEQIGEALAADVHRLAAADDDAADDPLNRLTAEQRAILAEIASGASLPAAAKSLFLSVRTVERRVSQIRRALGVRTTAEAIALASRHGRGGVPG